MYNEKKHLILTATVVVVIGIAAGAILFFITNNRTDNRTDDMIYQDAATEYGRLTVGITKTSPISIGVAEQIFDLDIGALEDGVPAVLQVDEVLVSAGQQVQKGTALFRVTAESVQNARAVLRGEIFKSDRECKLLQATQKELRLQASQGYDSEVMNGKYASVIYGSKCEELQKKADQAKEAVEHKQNEVNENLLQLTQTQQELVKAQKYLKKAEDAVSENYRSRYDNAYYYTVYENTRETAKKMAGQLEEQIENLTKKNETLLYEVDTAVRIYHQVLMDLEKEKLLAKMDYNTEIHASETASEWYDIQIATLDTTLQDAKMRYKNAIQKMREFNASVERDSVISKYNGILSDIAIESGYTLAKNDRLVTLYDQEAVTMDVLLSGEDYYALNQDKPVNISLAEHPNETYAGRITEVSNVEYVEYVEYEDSREALCYVVTVTIQGNAAEFYEGMSGEAIFLTNEERDVLYVPNKAVFREGKRSYVKLRKKSGKIVEKNVTTGFSDGNYIEIAKGLSAGDTVLMPVY